MPFKDRLGHEDSVLLLKEQLGDEAAPRQSFDGQKAAEHQPKIEHERQDEGAPTGLAKFVDRGFAA